MSWNSKRSRCTLDVGHALGLHVAGRIGRLEADVLRRRRCRRLGGLGCGGLGRRAGLAVDGLAVDGLAVEGRAAPAASAFVSERRPAGRPVEGARVNDGQKRGDGAQMAACNFS